MHRICRLHPTLFLSRFPPFFLLFRAIKNCAIKQPFIKCTYSFFLLPTNEQIKSFNGGNKNQIASGRGKSISWNANMCSRHPLHDAINADFFSLFLSYFNVIIFKYFLIVMTVHCSDSEFVCIFAVAVVSFLITIHRANGSEEKKFRDYY